MNDHNDVLQVFVSLDKYLCFSRSFREWRAYRLTPERLAKVAALLGKPRFDPVTGMYWSVFEKGDDAAGNA